MAVQISRWPGVESPESVPSSEVPALSSILFLVFDSSSNLFLQWQTSLHTFSDMCCQMYWWQPLWLGRGTVSKSSFNLHYCDGLRHWKFLKIVIGHLSFSPIWKNIYSVHLLMCSLEVFLPWHFISAILFKILNLNPLFAVRLLDFFPILRELSTLLLCCTECLAFP